MFACALEISLREEYTCLALGLLEEAADCAEAAAVYAHAAFEVARHG